MPSNLMTPGVLIDEKKDFPDSITPVQTSVPAFIGYTAFASKRGKAVSLQPVKINSLTEYIEVFGEGFKAKFDVNPADKSVGIKENHTFYLYNSIRLFYTNGGGACYIISVGTYGDKPNGLPITAADLTSPIDLLLKETEPSLIAIPDAIILGEQCYASIYTKVLQHCAEVQSRIAIFDLVNPQTLEDSAKVVSNFRDQIGINALSYGAAYLPWLKTSIVGQDEVTFENIDTDLRTLLPESETPKLIINFKALSAPTDADKKEYHSALKKASPVYVGILDRIREHLNQLPPSGAMASIYAKVDESRGVWKAPANVDVKGTNAPSINLSSYDQERLNEDDISGKSINVIRTLPGAGTLVWGARTLDGNSRDWRYVNVRRTIIMIEQSVKQTIKAYVFVPNNASTWAMVKSIIQNFLTNLWKHGALAGATSADAFDVQVGLGSTMTPTDILNGQMVISIKVAIVRPAEFSIITFQQQMQQS